MKASEVPPSGPSNLCGKKAALRAACEVIQNTRKSNTLKRNTVIVAAWLMALIFIVDSALLARNSTAVVREGTRILIELRTKLDADKTKRGKKFKAWTVEPIETEDGSVLPARSKIKGRVSHVRHNRMMLRFEEIKAGKTKAPLVATVVGVHGDKDVAKVTGKEGEIKTSASRVKRAVIGAALGAAIGTAARRDAGRRTGLRQELGGEDHCARMGVAAAAT